MSKKVVIRIPISNEIYQAVLEEIDAVKVRIGKPHLATKILSRRPLAGAQSLKRSSQKKVAVAKS